jgi:hypothetical protein
MVMRVGEGTKGMGIRRSKGELGRRDGNLKKHADETNALSLSFV